MNKPGEGGRGIERRRKLLATGAGAIGLSPSRFASAQQKITCRIAHSQAIGSPITVA